MGLRGMSELHRAMKERDAWLGRLLNVTERALDAARLIDPRLHLELLEIHARLQRRAAEGDVHSAQDSQAPGAAELTRSSD